MGHQDCAIQTCIAPPLPRPLLPRAANPTAFLLLGPWRGWRGRPFTEAPGGGGPRRRLGHCSRGKFWVPVPTDRGFRLVPRSVASESWGAGGKGGGRQACAAAGDGLRGYRGLLRAHAQGLCDLGLATPSARSRPRTRLLLGHLGKAQETGSGRNFQPYPQVRKDNLFEPEGTGARYAWKRGCLGSSGVRPGWRGDPPDGQRVSSRPCLRN